jgi:hypothetical protein
LAHAAPGPPRAVQTPPEQYALADWQSVSALHDERQAVVLAHLTPLGQAVGGSVAQLPDPLHAPVVS